MLKALKLVLGFFGGGIGQSLADAYKARQEAETDQEKIAAQERIDRLNAIRDVQKAEAGSRVNAIFRGILALGPAVVLFKLFVIDKVACPLLGWSIPNAPSEDQPPTAVYCATDPLSPEMWQVITAVIGFYFLYEGGIGIARIVRRK